MIMAKSIDFFAGVPVSDYAEAAKWYEQLLGFPPAFFPNDKEAVWKLAEHRYLYIVRQPEDAGHARLLMFVDDLDGIAEQIAARGLNTAKREEPTNNVRKFTYCDADGNEIAFGGGPSRKPTQTE